MKQLVRFLFGQEWAVFTNGQFGFEVRPQPAILVPLALLFGVFIYFVYIRPRARVTKPTRAILLLLRTTLIMMVVFLLLRPVVVVSSVIPRSSYVAVLVDDSLSMKLKDMPGGESRLDAVKQALLTSPGSGQDSFMNRLEERFKTDLYGFSGELVGLKDGNNLYGEGRSSDLGGALDEIGKRSAGLPLSAIVIATDGAANVPHDLGASLRELRARDVPVFTIGAGNTSRSVDAELTRVSVPRRVLNGSRINVEALVSLSGYSATKVLIGVREDGRAIKTE
jgi:hypothetical protein